jgi:hypothetical protein
VSVFFSVYIFNHHRLFAKRNHLWNYEVPLLFLTLASFYPVKRNFRIMYISGSFIISSTNANIKEHAVYCYGLFFMWSVFKQIIMILHRQ